jgi:hypothetical protein
MKELKKNFIQHKPHRKQTNKRKLGGIQIRRQQGDLISLKNVKIGHLDKREACGMLCYVTNRKVAVLITDEVNEFFFFSVYLILPAALCPGVYSSLEQK